jgi:hypothetical protein
LNIQYFRFFLMLMCVDSIELVVTLNRRATVCNFTLSSCERDTYSGGVYIRIALDFDTPVCSNKSLEGNVFRFILIAYSVFSTASQSRCQLFQFSSMATLLPPRTWYLLYRRPIWPRSYRHLLCQHHLSP